MILASTTATKAAYWRKALFNYYVRAVAAVNADAEPDAEPAYAWAAYAAAAWVTNVSIEIYVYSANAMAYYIYYTKL